MQIEKLELIKEKEGWIVKEYNNEIAFLPTKKEVFKFIKNRNKRWE